MESAYYAGIDGGGTLTRAVIVSKDGDLLGVGRAPSSNFDDIGLEAAQANLAHAVNDAWRQAGRPRVKFASIFLGMAGVVAARDRAHIADMARNLGLADDHAVHVDHDIRIAHAGALAGDEGIVLIAGTGSSCYGRTTTGKKWRAGGWGGLLDDEGGGYKLGLNALIATVRAHDGRGPATSLSQPVLAKLDLHDIDDIMHRLYVDGLSRTATAAFAPLVTEAAAAGDAVATAILKHGTEELAVMVEAVAKRLSFAGGLRVAVTGSIAHAAPMFKAFLYEAIAARIATVRIVEPALPSVLGAVPLADEAAGHPIRARADALKSSLALFES